MKAAEKFTSALDMRSSLVWIGLIVLIFLFCRNGTTGVVDRVVAAVDDIAITESELLEKHESMLKINSQATLDETLETMINRVLLIKDAKRFRMESKTDDELIDQYIDLKIRALIKVTDKEVNEYYKKNEDNFAGKSLEAVSGDIVKYLTELKVNIRLKENLRLLRQKSNVIINGLFSDE